MRDLKIITALTLIGLLINQQPAIAEINQDNLSLGLQETNISSDISQNTTTTDPVDNSVATTTKSATVTTSTEDTFTATTALDNISTTSTLDNTTASTTDNTDITTSTFDNTATSTSTTTTSTDNNNADNNNNSGASAQTENHLVPNTNINATAQKILNYFRSQQSNDGKIIDGNITDWAIISFAANNELASSIKNGEKSLLDYALNYDFSDASDLNICASYPRHILALMSAGASPNNANIKNSVTKLKNECYKNNLFGQDGINDDIFGLLALLDADEDINSSIIQDITNTIKNDQTNEGAFTWAGWPGADITGAAINVLKYAKNKGLNIDENIFTKAKTYLKNNQSADGGWGYGSSDALTTGWAIMGLNALGETQTQWLNVNNKNPWHPMVNLLADSGYYESAWAPGPDLFATKHAVPALLYKMWPINLFDPNFPVDPVVNTDIKMPGTSYAEPIITTTTTLSPTSTLPFITTSTPEIIIASTTVATTTVTTTENIIAPEITTSTSPVTANEIIATAPVVLLPTREPFKQKEIDKTPTENLTADILNNPTVAEITADLPLPRRARNIAKTVVAVSASGAGALGLYLGLKLFKNLL